MMLGLGRRKRSDSSIFDELKKRREYVEDMGTFIWSCLHTVSNIKSLTILNPQSDSFYLDFRTKADFPLMVVVDLHLFNIQEWLGRFILKAEALSDSFFIIPTTSVDLINGQDWTLIAKNFPLEFDLDLNIKLIRNFLVVC